MQLVIVEELLNHVNFRYIRSCILCRILIGLIDWLQDFREQFSDLQIGRLTEQDLKSEEAKAKWRAFAENYKTLGKLLTIAIGTIM